MSILMDLMSRLNYAILPGHTLTMVYMNHIGEIYGMRNLLSMNLIQMYSCCDLYGIFKQVNKYMSGMVHVTGVLMTTHLKRCVML